MRSWMRCANWVFLACLTCANFVRNAASSANGIKSLRRAVLSKNPSPMVSRNNCVNSGFDCINQRRGVMPLVLLVMRSGNTWCKSRNTVLVIKSECKAETPLTLCEPTKARLPIRTWRVPFSPINEIAVSKASLFGCSNLTWVSKRALMA